MTDQTPSNTAAAPVLSDAERRFLSFALDLAFDQMCSGDGFTDEDDAALASLRKLANGEPS
jgi:acyl carrier protein phosphodiesterase